MSQKKGFWMNLVPLLSHRLPMELVESEDVLGRTANFGFSIHLIELADLFLSSRLKTSFHIVSGVILSKSR